MAILKIRNRSAANNPIQKVSSLIKYIINPEKTEGGQFVATHNIIRKEGDVAENATEQMMETKRLFEKTDGRQMYHFIISFPEEDPVTPELAMQFGKEFCERYLREYEAVYAVHTDTDHIHIHIGFNSVNMYDGIKYRYEKEDWAEKIMPVVNELCRKHGLTVLEIEPDRKKRIEQRREKHQAKKSGVSYGKWK